MWNGPAADHLLPNSSPWQSKTGGLSGVRPLVSRRRSCQSLTMQQPLILPPRATTSSSSSCLADAQSRVSHRWPGSNVRHHDSARLHPPRWRPSRTTSGHGSPANSGEGPAFSHAPEPQRRWSRAMLGTSAQHPSPSPLAGAVTPRRPARRDALPIATPKPALQ